MAERPCEACSSVCPECRDEARLAQLEKALRGLQDAALSVGEESEDRGDHPYESPRDTSSTDDTDQREASCGDDVQAAEASAIGTTRRGSAATAGTSGIQSTDAPTPLPPHLKAILTERARAHDLLSDLGVPAGALDERIRSRVAELEKVLREIERIATRDRARWLTDAELHACGELARAALSVREGEG